MSWRAAAASACGVTLLAELGDKTFFVCALLAAKAPKWQIFAGGYSALVLQTIACICFGVLFKTEARALEVAQVRWDLIIGGLCLIGFGLHAANESLSMPPTLAEEQELPSLPLGRDLTVQEDEPSKGELYISDDVYMNIEQQSTMEETIMAFEPLAQVNAAKSEAATLIHTRNGSGDYMRAFGAVFAAELGDRSMFSTIAMAATLNPWGVLAGVAIGHCLVTLLAVTSANLLERYLSPRSTKLCAGIAFVAFGLVSIVEAVKALRWGAAVSQSFENH